MSADIINLTERAAEEIKVRLGNASADVKGLRVGVKSRGCSGMAYFMEYAEPDNSDKDDVVEAHGVKVFVPAESVMYILGTTIDYVSSDTEEGFVFNNPNEKGRCGCGESFNA